MKRSAFLVLALAVSSALLVAQQRGRGQFPGGLNPVGSLRSSAPVKGAMNGSYSATVSSVFVALKHIFPEVPINAGIFKTFGDGIRSAAPALSAI